MQQTITPWLISNIPSAPASAVIVIPHIAEPSGAEHGQMRTREELKAKFEREGKTFSGWAEARGYTRNEVYRVINGFAKCKRGKAHKIAVELGLKPSTGSNAHAA